MGEALLMNHKRKKKPEGLKYYDMLTNIGASETLEGAAYNEAGYFGTVTASKLFTGTELANAVGITQGIVQHDDTPWLKFYLDGKILFTPMKPIRNSISWNTLLSSNCVYGNKMVDKGELKFKVRLLKGIVTDVYNSTLAQFHYSEWNRLILPIHIQSKDKSWKHSAYVEQDLVSWLVDFTDEDLCTSTTSGNGNYTICQELNENGQENITRGYDGASSGRTNTKTATWNLLGWRPVLEVISSEELEGSN